MNKLHLSDSHLQCLDVLATLWFLCCFGVVSVFYCSFTTYSKTSWLKTTSYFSYFCNLSQGLLHGTSCASAGLKCLRCLCSQTWSLTWGAGQAGSCYGFSLSLTLSPILALALTSWSFLIAWWFQSSWTFFHGDCLSIEREQNLSVLFRPELRCPRIISLPLYWSKASHKGSPLGRGGEMLSTSRGGDQHASRKGGKGWSYVWSLSTIRIFLIDF